MIEQNKSCQKESKRWRDSLCISPHPPQMSKRFRDSQLKSSTCAHTAPTGNQLLQIRLHIQRALLQFLCPLKLPPAHTEHANARSRGQHPVQDRTPTSVQLFMCILLRRLPSSMDGYLINIYNPLGDIRKQNKKTNHIQPLYT